MKMKTEGRRDISEEPLKTPQRLGGDQSEKFKAPNWE
jgi:hypothetical protein